MSTVFITGATGYMGTRLINELNKEGVHTIKALVRKQSEHKLPPGCEAVYGDALNAATYQDEVKGADVFVHLVGVAHPSPAKKEQFRKIDLVSVQEAAKAAAHAGVAHFIYLSVSMYPIKIMKDFQQARAEGEELLLSMGMQTSFLRPWYVLGPGHWWPLVLKPFFLIAKLIPSKREAAQHLDTVTIKQMIAALKYAIGHPPESKAVYEVGEIKRMS